MLSRILAIPCLLALMRCQQNNGDFSTFSTAGTAPPTATAQLTRGPSTLAAGAVTSKPSAQKYPSCSLQGKAGECVPYYLCESGDDKANDDGEDVTDTRVQDVLCKFYTDVCCLAADMTEGSI